MRIAIVGDVMLGRLLNQALMVEQPAYPWGNTLPLFAASDLRICNLECVLADRGRPWSVTSKMFHFRSNARNVAVLQAAQINLVSLANNHVLDYEYDALFEMLEVLQRANIHYAGAGRDRDDAWRPAQFAVGETRIAAFALTDNVPEWEATDKVPGVCYVPVEREDERAKRLFASVGKAKSGADCVIVSCHWGPNWGYEPPDSHLAFAHALVDAGADIVFGHSPHVFRGIELYRGHPILYSAGNFIDDYAVDEVERNDESFVFTLNMEHGIVQELELYPTLIREFQALLAEPPDALRIGKKMQALCERLGTRATWDSSAACLKIPVREPAEEIA
jgi:poly-gamma-glutamate synthesis protein (capsule biosynthesis protein)